MRAALALAAALLLAAAWSVVGGAGAPPARAASDSQLQQQIFSGRQRVHALAGAVAAASQRVNQLNAAVSAITRRLHAVQHDLSAKQKELTALKSKLAAARVRLQHLEVTEAADEQVLAQQAIGSYEGDQPDIVSVVLSSTGFSDLLERLDFVQRIGRHDSQIVGSVKAARRAVAAEAVRLGALSVRQQRLTNEVRSERNSIAGDWMSLLRDRLQVARLRAAEAGRLTNARARVASLSDQLSRVQAQERAAAVAAAAAAAQRQAAAGAPGGGSGGAAAPGAAPSAPSSGGFTFPMPPGDVSPPGTWSLDDGVDISAPGGTPELAVCSGTVVLHGIGGFGPSAPVLHCDSSLGGYDYVYYGHAGPGNWVPVGTHVSQGQVISQVGYGIVGISTGPHLEIGFADSSGSPIGPGSAPTMMSLLRASY